MTNLSELQTGCCDKGDPECFCKSEHVQGLVGLGLVEWRMGRPVLTALGVQARAKTAPVPASISDWVMRAVYVGAALFGLGLIGLIVWAVGRW